MKFATRMILETLKAQAQRPKTMTVNKKIFDTLLNDRSGIIGIKRGLRKFTPAAPHWIQRVFVMGTEIIPAMEDKDEDQSSADQGEGPETG